MSTKLIATRQNAMLQIAAVVAEAGGSHPGKAADKRFGSSRRAAAAIGAHGEPLRGILAGRAEGEPPLGARKSTPTLFVGIGSSPRAERRCPDRRQRHPVAARCRCVSPRQLCPCTPATSTARHTAVRYTSICQVADCVQAGTGEWPVTMTGLRRFMDGPTG